MNFQRNNDPKIFLRVGIGGKQLTEFLEKAKIPFKEIRRIENQGKTTTESFKVILDNEKIQKFYKGSEIPLFLRSGEIILEFDLKPD
ncbi:MAG TPA: hypothetical protein PLQ82_08315 [Desulfobacteraceae bacterium]|nr:hypothetical protein [Desulfobacteraceae bacterium]